MIRDERIKTIYLHNPKTGGTFFRAVYGRRYTRGEAYGYWKVYDADANADMGHISYLNIARYVPGYRDWRIITMLRNPYDRFVSGWKETCLHRRDIAEISGYYGNDPERVTDWLVSSKYAVQDYFLRSHSLPWMYPQTYFTREDTIVLHYEKQEDWNFLMNVFGITEAEKVDIRQPYILTDRTRENIRRLYPEDIGIFEMYERQ